MVVQTVEMLAVCSDVWLVETSAVYLDKCSVVSMAVWLVETSAVCWVVSMVVYLVV